MAQLIEMRKRIAAIETTKKITHAMRLIAMSTHSRLKSKEEPLQIYKENIQALFAKLQAHVPTWSHPALTPTTRNNPLIIIVGSTKGLCGNFNTALFNFFEKKHLPCERRYSIIAIGKKAIDYASSHHQRATIVASFKELSTATLLPIAQEITGHILNASPHYSSVTIFSNISKTFFLQRPEATVLIPFSVTPETNDKYAQEYIWEQQPADILQTLTNQTIAVHLQFLLFESLLAEHAARFISMDNSTRNAQNLLETTKLNYNKLRQAKITKEIAELIGSF